MADEAPERLTANGEPERGLREIDPVEAAVVRRIFADDAAEWNRLAQRRACGPCGRSSGTSKT